jgi:2-polyprenyl-6-methoxyphenol hydroxylase-like FAD-dependent oxidoreductase
MRFPVGEMARRHGAPPATNVPRGDLLKLLAAAVGPGAVRLGARCERVEQDEGGVTAHLQGGGQERGAMLVGADGIDSAMRALLFKDAKPRFAGYQYLRALVRYEHPSHPPGHFSFTFGRGDRIGLHNMGRGRMYWFAVIVTPPGSTDGKAGRKAELVERFKDFAPPVPAAIAAAEEPAIGRTDIRDLKPLERWGDGRIILMGDAAHATTPNLGRGASEAIEDAVALARVLGSADALSDRGPLVSALRSFEELRRQETSVVQTKAWRIGRLASWSSLPACAFREFVMEHIASRAMRKSFESDFAGPGALS